MASWSRPPERVAGVWRAYRHTARGFPPLWYGGGSVSTRQESGRWHVEGEGVAQYLALSANGAWAERCRYASIRDDRRRLEDRRRLWELQVIEQDIADLSSFDRYIACGLSPSLAVGPHVHARALADDLRAVGYRGVLSPAAAYDQPGAANLNLTLFGERIEAHEYGAMPDPSANPRPDLFIQAIMITDAGVATEWAMQHTCYQGGHHQTLAAWNAQRPGRRGARARGTRSGRRA
jgi:hypothetical protein